MMEKLFPTVLMTLDVLAGVVCLCHGDIKRCVYWLTCSSRARQIKFKFW